MNTPISDDWTVQDKTITSNGLRFHYREWGSASAPCLVLLHGYLCHAGMFDSLAQLMSDHFRVLAVDQRGHGGTDWSTEYGPDLVLTDFEALANVLRLDQLSLLGYSFGGPIAYRYAARHPQRVRRLVLVETGGVASQPTREFEIQIRGWRGLPSAVDAIEEAERALHEVIPEATGAALDEFVRAGLKEQRDGRWTWRWDPRLLDVNLGPSAEYMWQTLPKVVCPTLVIRGENSGSVSLQVAERIAAALPNGALVNIPDSGHFLWFENQAGIESAIREFLAR